jgi:hypothetical protein
MFARVSRWSLAGGFADGGDDLGATRKLGWIHWDDVDKWIGRPVRVHNGQIVYSLPQDKRHYDRDSLEFVLGNTLGKIVRSKLDRPEMDPLVLRLRDITDAHASAYADIVDTSGVRCLVCVRLKLDGYTKGLLPSRCAMCLQIMHWRCAADLSKTFATPGGPEAYDFLMQALESAGSSVDRVRDVVGKEEAFTQHSLCPWCWLVAAPLRTTPAASSAAAVG